MQYQHRYNNNNRVGIPPGDYTYNNNNNNRQRSREILMEPMEMYQHQDQPRHPSHHPTPRPRQFHYNRQTEIHEDRENQHNPQRDFMESRDYPENIPREIQQVREYDHRPSKDNRKARDVRQRQRQLKHDSPTRAQPRPRPKRSEVGICTKYILFVVNFFVFIIGLALTSLSSYILHLKGKQFHDVIDFFLDPSCDLCLAGSILLLMGFVGFYGALRENTIFLRLHYYLMALFLLVQLSVCILTFVMYYSTDIRDKIFPTDTFRNAIKKYRDDIDMQNLIDSMQKELECCGLSDSEEGFLDWNDNPYFRCANNTSPEECSVPSSCCKQQQGKKINHKCGWKAFKVDQITGEIVSGGIDYTANINTMGCLKSLGNWIDNHALVVGGVLLGVLLPQIFQIVLTTNLIKMIGLQKLRWRQ